MFKVQGTNIITGDETWMCEYDPEEWHTANSLQPTKMRMST